MKYTVPIVWSTDNIKNIDGGDWFAIVKYTPEPEELLRYTQCQGTEKPTLTMMTLQNILGDWYGPDGIPLDPEVYTVLAVAPVCVLPSGSAITKLCEASNRENYGIKEVDFVNSYDPEWQDKHPEDYVKYIPQGPTFCGVGVWDDEEYNKSVENGKREDAARAEHSKKLKEFNEKQRQKKLQGRKAFESRALDVLEKYMKGED